MNRRACAGLAITIIGVGGFAPCGNAELIISEYVEGSSNNKAVELYNSASDTVNLTGFQLEIYSNGSSTPSSTIALSGQVGARATYVVGNSSATSAVTSVANQVTGSLSFNGNDALILRANGVIVDSFGQVGVNPGTEWGTGLVSTMDNTLRRKADVRCGDTNAFDSFEPALEWNGYAIDTFDGLCWHTMNEPPAVSITNAAMQCGVAVLGWRADREDLTYMIETCADVSVGGWAPVLPTSQWWRACTAWTNTDASAEQRFFRLKARTP